MNILWFLIPIAFALSSLFLAFFINSVYKGQYDTIDTDAQLPLSDPDLKSQPPG